MRIVRNKYTLWVWKSKRNRFFESHDFLNGHSINKSLKHLVCILLNPYIVRFFFFFHKKTSGSDDFGGHLKEHLPTYSINPTIPKQDKDPITKLQEKHTWLWLNINLNNNSKSHIATCKIIITYDKIGIISCPRLSLKNQYNLLH